LQIFSIMLVIETSLAGLCFNPNGITTKSAPNDEMSVCAHYSANTCCTPNATFIDLLAIENQISSIRRYFGQNGDKGCRELVELALCAPCAPFPVHQHMICRDFCRIISTRCPQRVWCMYARSVAQNPTISCDNFDQGQSSFSFCENMPTTGCFNSAGGLVLSFLFLIVLISF